MQYVRSPSRACPLRRPRPRPASHHQSPHHQSPHRRSRPPYLRHCACFRMTVRNTPRLFHHTPRPALRCKYRARYSVAYALNTPTNASCADRANAKAASSTSIRSALTNGYGCRAIQLRRIVAWSAVRPTGFVESPCARVNPRRSCDDRNRWWPCTRNRGRSRAPGECARVPARRISGEIPTACACASNTS